MTDLTENDRMRLEGLRQGGRMDTALEVIERGTPLLDELGIDADTARSALRDPVSGLESAGGMTMSQLEAIIVLTNRPPFIVRNNKVEDKAAMIGPFPAGTDIKVAAMEHLLPSVGRIEFLNHDREWGGTGWVVDEDGPDHLLVATNRHVAKIVARRTANGNGVFLFSPGNMQYGASIDFVEEVGSQPDPARVARIESFTYLADDAASDVALGRIRKPAAGLGIAPLPLAEVDGENKELVAVVGYPASDPFRNDPNEMEKYFKGLYDVKRFSPGYLRAQGGPTILGHDCTTLGGNSGSPVISLDSGKVVGLHFAGRYGSGNSAVRISTVRRLLDRGAAGDMHGTGPADPATPTDESSDGSHGPEYFEGREGYDPAFLRVVEPVPLPVVPPVLDLAKPSDATPERPHELRYQHFGILYSLERKSPVIAALNLDGTRSIPLKRSSSRWYKDLRIPAEAQLGRVEYGDPDIDRGHMVRRSATNWGDSVEEAKQSNKDSYHYTVASPQHKGLNRNPATWLGLENHILGSARTHGFRCNVFTGPIFGHADQPLDPDAPQGSPGARIPTEYFKVVSMPYSDGSDGILRLHATAYVLSQGHLVQRILINEGAPEAAEGFAFGDYRTFQVRIRDLEMDTGYDFGPLRDADPLARQIGTEAAEGAPVRPLDELDEIVL